MSLNGARLRYVDENGEEVLVPAKGRTFQIGSYFNCDVILEPQAERLICEITCDAFGRVTLLNQSNKDTAIHLNDKIIHGQRSHPLLHGNRITILDRVYTWESHKMSGSEDVASTPERLPPVEQAPNSCPSLKSHRPQIDKRLTVHNFNYSINSDDEGNTSIESRDQNKSHLDEQESLNLSTPPSTEISSCETPKVDLVEATQNKENTATPTASHQLLQLCALSDVVITSFSPRETGVKVEKSFTCVRKPTKIGKQATAASVTMSTPKSVYSTPKGGVLSELNDDSCSRDLMDFSTPSTSKKTKRQSSMFLIDLTTPSKLRPSLKPTPISVDSTDESSDGSPIVIDITNSATPPTPGRSHLAKTPQRPANAVAATPTRTPQSLMKRALLTSTKKKQIANKMDKTPVATPKRPSPRRLCTPRMPFVTLPTPEQKEARRAVNLEKNDTPKSVPHKRQSLHLGTPRDNKLSQIRKSLAAAKRSPVVEIGIRLKAKARRTLNSPKSSSPNTMSSKPASPTINMSQPKCSTPEKLDDSLKDELSRTFTILNDSGEPVEEGSILGIISALVTGEINNSVASKILETSLPPKDIKENLLIDDRLSEKLETGPQSVVEKVKSPSKDDSKLSCQEKANEKADIIEDSICEEVHANIPNQIDDDAKLSKVMDTCEEQSPDIKSSDSVAEEEKNEQTSQVETPVIRRSLRRLSVDQKAGVTTTPRRGSSSRRGSMGASSNQAETKTEDSKKGTRRASCSALVDVQEVSCTPRRKRRFSEQMCTPTRQSKRLMKNTPKSTLQVDDSIGDMGVIVEEDDAEKSSIVEDENYGQELPCDEPDNVDYHGLRDLLKTPKNCSTPRFKGLRELMRTPKVPASPIFGNIEELLDNSIDGSPHQNKSSRSITVARVEVEKGKALEGVLKTPSARNIMVPNEPASAILKSRSDSLATTTEYDLGMTNTTLHLDKIFDDVPSTSVANMNDTETEINVTALSTASGLDPLKKSVSSEAPMSVCKLEVPGVASRKNDPLTSTTYKTAMQADLELSTAFTEEGEASSRPSSLGSNEMSGMQLLDQTSDSMFSEPLIVSGVDSCNVTVDETKALGQTTYQPVEINDIDTDSNVGLMEPLVLSDDDDEAEVVEDSRVTSKKSIAATEISVAYNLEESVASKDTTLNQAKLNQSVNETSVVGETNNKENDSLIEEVSLIEVNESLAGDSISTTKDGKSLVIEIDSCNDTDAEPTKENDKSAAVELSIVDSESFPLDSTQEDEVSASVDQKPVDSGSEQGGIVTEVPTHASDLQIQDPLPSEEAVLEKSRTTDGVLADEEKGNEVSAAVDPEIPLDATVNSSVIVDEGLSTNCDPKPSNSEVTIAEEHSTCKRADQSIININEMAEEKTIGDDVCKPVDSKTLPLDSTADSHIVLEEEILTNVNQKPINIESSSTANDVTAKAAEEDVSKEMSVTNASPSKELAEQKITGDNVKENNVSAVVDSEILPVDSTADTSVVVEEEFLTNIDQKPIDSDLPITTTELGDKQAEDLPVVDVTPSEEQPEDKITGDDAKETAADVDSLISSLDSPAEPPTNDDQKPIESVPSITSEDSTQAELPTNSEPNEASETEVEDLSVIDVLPCEESVTDKLPVDSNFSDETTAEHNQNESISTVTQPEVGEVSVTEKPETDAEPSTSKASLVAETNDDTAEKPKAEPEQITVKLPHVDGIEVQKAEVEELPTSTTVPYIHDVEGESHTEDSGLEASASPSPSPANIEVDKTSAVQDTDAIDPGQQVQQKKDLNPCGNQETNDDKSMIIATEGTSKQNVADKTQMELESVCEAESNKEQPSIGELSMSESAHVTPAEQSPAQEVAEESSPADITAVDQQEKALAAIDDSAVKEKNKDEDVNKTDAVLEDSTSLETTQNKSCYQEPLSPKVVSPRTNMADEENPSNASSIIMESFTEQHNAPSTGTNPIHSPETATNQGESTDEDKQLDKSSPAEDAGEDSVVKETPRATSSVNDPEVVATSEEMIAQQVELKAIEESSDHLKKSNEAEETSIDTSVTEKPEVAAEETSQDESIAEILESSVSLENSSSSAAPDKSVAENTEISSTEAPNSSIAVDAAQEASAQDAPETSKTQDKTASDHESLRDSESTKDKPTSTDTEFESKSSDGDMTETQQSEKAVQESVLSELVPSPDNCVKSPTETDNLSIEEIPKEAVNNPSVAEDEVMSEELPEETSTHDDHCINTKSANQSTLPIDAVEEVSAIVELSDDSESPPSEEAHNPSPPPASEVDAAVLIEESLVTEDPKDTKVDDVPKEGTSIAGNRNTVKYTSDIIELSDDSSSESLPLGEDHSADPLPAAEADTSVPTAETLPTVESVPKESTPIAEELNTNNGPDSEANASVSAIETIANQDPNKEKVEDVPDELQHGAPAAPVTTQEELTEKPQASEKLSSVDVDADETTSRPKSVTNVEQDDKSQHKSEVEGSADVESPSKQKDESSGEVSSTVDLDLENVQDTEVSIKMASNSESIKHDKLATPIISSSEPETSDKFRDPSPEPSQSLKHSTMEAMHNDPKSIRHEDEPSDKEKLKSGKRATRKVSASVETPSEDAVEKPSRRARKPSAEVEDKQSNDFLEKPKRRVLRKASEEVEAMTPIHDKEAETNEEEVLKIIPEEPHSSRANEENEPTTEAASDHKQEEDAQEKPMRRVRKPSEKAKLAEIVEKPKRRARKPSAEVPEPVVQEEEQAHSSNINKLHDLQEEVSSQKQEVEVEEERIQNKEEIAEEPREQNELQQEEEEQPKKSKESKKSRTARPKRRGRKASEEETEPVSGKKPKIDDLLKVIEEKDTPTSSQIELEPETQKPERAKRRGRKASTEEDTNNVVSTSEEVLKSVVEDDNESNAIIAVNEEPQKVHTEVRSRRRARKPSKEEVLDGAAASQAMSANGNEEKPLPTASEDQPSEPNGPKKRTRKSSEFVPAEVQECAKETDPIQRPKRRGRKPSVDTEHVDQDVPERSRRRGRTPAEPEKQPSGEAMEEEPDKKSRRTARKPTTETVDAVAHNVEEHLKGIEEVAEPEPEPDVATAETTTLPEEEEEEEPKTRRRGRKLNLETLEMPAKSTAEVGHSRLRGRKATEDDVHKSEDPVEAETIPEEEQHNIVPEDSNNEVEAEVAATEKKPKRRVRKVSKKTTSRRGRKEDPQENENGQEKKIDLQHVPTESEKKIDLQQVPTESEKKIDLQQVPTESVQAIVVMSGDIGDGVVGSEDDFTPRRREGRNMPRKNYDETTDEDKQRSARRQRKPASKLLNLKGPEEASTPLPIPQPVEEVETPLNAVPIAELSSTQRREGRNLPRKNYTEAPDDDKPSTSRNRRVRNLSAKALELIVDSTSPKGRKTKAAAKDEIPAKRASLEAAPPTQAESGAEEVPAPVIAKGRAARRKADDDLSELVAAPPSKRGVRGHHEDAEEQPEAKPAAKNARATGRKAKVESDLDEAAPAKKARGGSRAKTSVKPPEDKSGTEPEEHSSSTKKGRGGKRAKTPVGMIPEDTATKPEDEPAKKPSARSRARGGAKAVVVPEPEQPVQDSDVEPVLPATTASRGGRAKKVHFEATEIAATAVAIAEDAPKRATRSRRK